MLDLTFPNSPDAAILHSIYFIYIQSIKHLIWNLLETEYRFLIIDEILRVFSVVRVELDFIKLYEPKHD
jgi:hypothetical protein